MTQPDYGACEPRPHTAGAVGLGDYSPASPTLTNKLAAKFCGSCSDDSASNSTAMGLSCSTAIRSSALLSETSLDIKTMRTSLIQGVFTGSTGDQIH